MVTPRRLAMVAVCLLALVASALLAWWQWERYQSVSGTLQNLGYVLQWPLFGAFPAFMFWRLHRMGRQHRDTAESDGVMTEEPRSEQIVTPTRSKLAYVPRQQAPPDGDTEALAYNRYLAQLNTREEWHGD